MFQTVLKMLFDPRGRISRSELLIVAAVLLGLEIIVVALNAHFDASGTVVVFLLKTLMVLIGVSAAIKRLHDMNYSGWWILGGAAILCMWTAIIAIGGLFTMGREVLLPGSTGHFMLLGLVMLPPIGMTLWMHFTVGDSHKNVYGAPSGITLGRISNVEAKKMPQNHQQSQNSSEIVV